MSWDEHCWIVTATSGNRVLALAVFVDESEARDFVANQPTSTSEWMPGGYFDDGYEYDADWRIDVVRAPWCPPRGLVCEKSVRLDMADPRRIN